MALALYRRYRPDTFAGVIGQDQVTVPLMRALDEGKLTHAYLFSGPRGCGKTSSARILARCVNCAKGPTSTPCGECESCKDLATGGPGSIDVVEIDAASHNGVDDARELRERAGFAPARDRYKIFILDEAHMVTPQGFNALLKIVEEPPEHVMFVFATTEPDKVIGTIRSRTHHYPFRLVPQEVMGPYLETICEKESIKPEAGVLRLAMRAGGGSVRDTLSVLDQLMVGAVDGVITHDASVALLGFTPEKLIGEAVDAVIGREGEGLYGVIQKVVVGGFDPKRFVEDLLARVRDLLVLTLAGERAEAVLSDSAEGEDLDELRRQAGELGLTTLTVMADTINSTLSDMAGATSPRMRLELLAARLLAIRESPAALVAMAGTGNGPAGGVAGVGDVAGAVGGGFAGANGAGGSAGAAGGALAAGNANMTGGGFAGAARNRQQGSGFAGASRNQRAEHTSSDAPKPNGGQGTDAASRPSNEGAGAQGPNVQAKNIATGGPSAAEAADGGPTATAVAGIAAAGTTATGAVGTGVSQTVDEGRTPDERWDALVGGLPADVRRYVDRVKVPRIKLDGRRLWLKFDVPQSKYAFALGMASEAVNGKTKVVEILRAEVHRIFGAQVSIAPTEKMANGEIAPAFRRLPADEQQRIKARLLQENLGAALAAAQGQTHQGHEASAAAASGERVSDGDDSEVHRTGGVAGSMRQASDVMMRTQSGMPAGGASVADVSANGASADGASSSGGASSGRLMGATADDDDEDPWAKPMPEMPGTVMPAQKQAAEHHKHVAVPDMSDDSDPWATPPSPVLSASTASSTPVTPTAVTPAASLGMPSATVSTSSATSAAPGTSRTAMGKTDSTDPWQDSAQERQNLAAEEDPWRDVPPPMEPSAGTGEWALPGPTRPLGNAGTGFTGFSAPVASVTPGNVANGSSSRLAQSDGSSGVSVSAQAGQTDAGTMPGDGAASEYSMSDESLETATALGMDDLKKLFDVKKVEEFAADDPRNPRHLARTKHTEE